MSENGNELSPSLEKGAMTAAQPQGAPVNSQMTAAQPQEASVNSQMTAVSPGTSDKTADHTRETDEPQEGPWNDQ